MNEKTLKDLLHEVPDADWQAVAQGRGLLLLDDTRLAVGPADGDNVLLCPPSSPGATPADLRQQALDDAAALLATYYLSHPLSLAGFNRQVEALLAEYGATAFAAEYGDTPARTLFVEGGRVVAEGPDSPRHRYGAFCELDEPLHGAELAARLRTWLDSGEAHERYLSMNVCRYNC